VKFNYASVSSSADEKNGSIYFIGSSELIDVTGTVAGIQLMLNKY
jgi:hypothetical protein